MKTKIDRKRQTTTHKEKDRDRLRDHKNIETDPHLSEEMSTSQPQHLPDEAQSFRSQIPGSCSAQTPGFCSVLS